eukprot:COSAG01_NODE_48097_length_384_cov_0.715789_1_plen_100_part_01
MRCEARPTGATRGAPQPYGSAKEAPSDSVRPVRVARLAAHAESVSCSALAPLARGSRYSSVLPLRIALRIGNHHFVVAVGRPPLIGDSSLGAGQQGAEVR